MTRTLKGLIHEHQIRCDAKWTEANPHMTDMPSGSSHWRVTLRCGRRQMTVPFSQGPAICHEPETVDVLDCLLSDASSADQSFEEWASDLGFDTDSRKAERIYRAVEKQTAKLRRFLGDNLETFLYAER